MATQFAHIRQRALLKRFTFLNNQIIKQKSKRNLITLHFICKNRFLELNKNLAYLAKNFKQFSAFWVVPLSTHFAALIAVQCYLAYISFFVTRLFVFLRILLIYGLFLAEALQWALIHRCAKVATENRRLEKVNARFYSLLFINSKENKHFTKSKNQVIFQIKAEWLGSHHRLRPFVMHLLDNCRITSKTFYFVGVNTALFFMILFKNQTNEN